MKIGIDRYGIGTDDWCYLGVVAGVLYIGTLGVSIRIYGPKRGSFTLPSGSRVTRLWPFVFVRR